ncbi:hypothetical protein B14911_05876 [Bacillus sp. NRRL B-14911]|jgi:hypothetical protein|nr:hypothetical protein B14911_05876 [Bacillus sp. NRRL B-14911]
MLDAAWDSVQVLQLAAALDSDVVFAQNLGGG